MLFASFRYGDDVNRFVGRAINGKHLDLAFVCSMLVRFSAMGVGGAVDIENDRSVAQLACFALDPLKTFSVPAVDYHVVSFVVAKRKQDFVASFYESGQNARLAAIADVFSVHLSILANRDTRSRTGNLLLMKQTLCQLSYVTRTAGVGLEPTTTWLTIRRSANLSYPASSARRGSNPALRLGKPVRCRLHHGRGSRPRESNPEPPPYESDALPVELGRRQSAHGDSDPGLWCGRPVRFQLRHERV